MFFNALKANIDNDENESNMVEDLPALTTSATAMATAAPDHDPSVSMNNFYPALVQCFGIIICG